jgi:hypothetical protein
MIFRKVQLWANANKRPPKISPYFVIENDSIMVTPLHVAHVGSKEKNERHKTTW